MCKNRTVEERRPCQRPIPSERGLEPRANLQAPRRPPAIRGRHFILLHHPPPSFYSFSGTKEREACLSFPETSICFPPVSSRALSFCTVVFFYSVLFSLRAKAWAHISPEGWGGGGACPSVPPVHPSIRPSVRPDEQESRGGGMSGFSWPGCCSSRSSSSRRGLWGDTGKGGLRPVAELTCSSHLPCWTPAAQATPTCGLTGWDLNRGSRGCLFKCDIMGALHYSALY